MRRVFAIGLLAATVACVTPQSMRERGPDWAGSSSKTVQEIAACLGTNLFARSSLPVSTLTIERGISYSITNPMYPSMTEVTVDVLDLGQRREVRYYGRRAAFSMGRNADRNVIEACL